MGEAEVLLVQVEGAGEYGPVNPGVVVGREAVVSHDGRRGEEELEYVSIEHNILVWGLAAR
ncbi:hypothetical protein ABT072_25850 [Streptomyces sp. NPDC002589]|uniref:hypothetical protein n=1 Tax=Streptomyces sp. NPDC002589 TaxID=3154420 RepID=UPI0033228C3F